MSQKTAKTVTIKFLNKQNQTVKVDVLLVLAVLLQSSSNLRVSNEISALIPENPEECEHSSGYFFNSILNRYSYYLYYFYHNYLYFSVSITTLFIRSIFSTIIFDSFMLVFLSLSVLYLLSLINSAVPFEPPIYAT